METSSVALVLLDFPSAKSTHSTSKTDITLYADEFKLPKLRPILTLVTQIFQFFSDYFQVPYPLKKLDIIAIPNFGDQAGSAYGIIYIRYHKLHSIKSELFLSSTFKRFNSETNECSEKATDLPPPPKKKVEHPLFFSE